MKLKNKKWVFICIGVLITLLGYFLRLQQFSLYPPIGDTYDEYKAAFNGISLIEKHVPASWSWLGGYKDFPVQKIRGVDYRIVQPWFDEPPLFSLMSGAYAMSHNMTSLGEVDAGALRYPMVKLGALNIFLLFLIIYILRNPLEAILGSLIYATEPTIILGSRLPLSDNMVTSFALISLLFLIIFIKKNQWRFLVLLGIVSGSAILLKSTAIFIPVSLILLLAACRKFKASFYVTIFMLSALVIWLAYGYYYDWSLFLKIISISNGRELLQPTMINNLLNITRIAEELRPFDGWLIWGWIAIIVYPFLQKGEDSVLSKLILPIVTGTYLIFFAIMSGHVKGWYRYPFYPFISWASAAFILEIIKNPRLLTSFFFITLPVSSSYVTGNGFAKFNPSQIRIYQILFLATMAPIMCYEIFKKTPLKIIVQSILIIALVAAIIFNITTITSFQDNFWYRW